MSTRPCSSFSFDHSYELPLRRNLLILLDILRFVAGVLLDRLGVAPCHGGVQLPQFGEAVDAAAAELILEAALRAHSSSGIISSRTLTTAPLYRPRRASLPPADDRGESSSSGEDDEGAAVCAICLAGLDAGGGCQQQQVAELCGCSHAFHAACIDEWVSSSGEATTCPLCRAPVSPVSSDGPPCTVGHCLFFLW